MKRLVLATFWLLRGQYFSVWQTGSQKVVSTISLFFSVIVGLIIPHTHGIPSKAYFWPFKIKLGHSGSSVMRGIKKMAPLWKHSNGAYDLLAATPRFVVRRFFPCTVTLFSWKLEECSRQFSVSMNNSSAGQLSQLKSMCRSCYYV